MPAKHVSDFFIDRRVPDLDRLATFVQVFNTKLMHRSLITILT
jgi:hypothetical protein